MNKFLKFIALVVFAILTGSCQKSIIVERPDDTDVSFRFSFAEPLTKAIADGKNADILYYEIYGSDLSVEKPLAEGSVPVSETERTFVLDISLVKDQVYNFIFWAQVDGQNHYDVTDLRKVRILSYDDEKANDETRAAFFAHKTFYVSGRLDEKVTLYRPFAQLNIAASSYETSLNLADKLTVQTSGVTVNGIADVFNTITGKGEGRKTVEFEVSSTPEHAFADSDKMIEVNGKEYYWIGMNYLIVNGENDNVTVDMTLNTNHGTVNHTVSNVPIKENFRTNIIGDILTTDARFEVIVDKEFVDDIVKYN